MTGWAWACAPSWVLPPRRHILEVCSASLLRQRRKLPPGSLAQVIFVCQTAQMHFPSADNFWEFISSVIRGGFTPSPVVLQSLFQMSSVLSHLGFLQSICVPMAWQASGCCPRGWCNEALSMLLPLCVLKLSPEATNSVKTYLITGMVPANDKWGFSPEVTVTRQDKTKENVSFPHCRWHRRRIRFLLEMCAQLSWWK